MTAPRPDLDALAHTVDAMRQAGVSGVTISVDEADALIAAAREREAAERRAQNHEAIWHAVVTGVSHVTGVAYGDPSDVIDCVRHLLADAESSREALTAERQRAEQAERRAARVRAHIDQEAIRSSTGVVIPAIDRALYIIDAALAEGQDG